MLVNLLGPQSHAAAAILNQSPLKNKKKAGKLVFINLILELLIHRLSLVTIYT